MSRQARLLPPSKSLGKAITAPHDSICGLSAVGPSLSYLLELCPTHVYTLCSVQYLAPRLDYWEGRCAITALAVPELLRASHIKPWADCDHDKERLDVFNGFCCRRAWTRRSTGDLSPWPTTARCRCQEALDAEARVLLGLDRPGRVRSLTDGHRRYLAWHRARVFRTQK
jgi:hypothetical protein